MMKIFSCITALFLICHLMSAQSTEAPKNMVAGGYMTFSIQENALPNSFYSVNGNIGSIISGSTSDRNTTYFSFEPYIGKQISSHWLLGIQLHYSLDRYKAEGTMSFPQVDTFILKQKENGYGVGVFGRYSFNPENRFVFFMQPYLHYSMAVQKDFRDETETGGFESYSIGIGTSGGVLYEISETIRVTTRFGVLGFVTGQWTDTESEIETSFHSFGTALNLSSLYFGFEVKF